MAAAHLIYLDSPLHGSEGLGQPSSISQTDLANRSSGLSEIMEQDFNRETETMIGTEAKEPSTLRAEGIASLPLELLFLILDNLSGKHRMNFLYTSKRLLYHLVRYFANRSDNIDISLARLNRNVLLLKAILSSDALVTSIEDEIGYPILDLMLRDCWHNGPMVYTLLDFHKDYTQKLLRHHVLAQSVYTVRLILLFENVNMEDNHYTTLLHAAICHGGHELAKLLALHAQSSDFEKINDQGHTPLHLAIRYGFDEVVDIYTSATHAHSDVQLMNSLLLYAIEWGRELMALEILRFGGQQIDAILQHTFLRHTIRGGNDLTIRKVIRQMTTIDYEDFLTAVANNRSNALRFLWSHLNTKEQINLGDLLIYAFQHENTTDDIILVLLHHLHADPCYNKDGRTALSYAAEFKPDIIPQLLRNQQVNPSLCDKDGRTPLEYALATPSCSEDILGLLALDYRMTPSSFADRGQRIMASLWKGKASRRRLYKQLQKRDFSITRRTASQRTKGSITPQRTNKYNLRSQQQG